MTINLRLRSKCFWLQTEKTSFMIGPLQSMIFLDISSLLLLILHSLFFLFSRCSHDTDSVYSTDVSICFSSPSVVSDSLSETDSTKENICSCDEGDPVPNIALPPLPNSSLANSEQLLPHPFVGSPSDFGSKPTPINTSITHYSDQERLLCKQRYAF